MLSTIFKGKTSSNESSASTGLWHLALNRLKSDRIAVVSFVIILFYFILLALSMTGVIASNWNKEVAVSYAPPTFLGADTESDQMKDSRGYPMTQALFLETIYSPYAIWTFDDEDKE